MNILAFTLPTPPSTNNLFATVMVKGKPRRIPSREYKTWKEEATGLVNLAWQTAGYPEFQRHMSLTIHIGLNYSGDISNRIKAIEDAIGPAIPGFPDDRYYDQVAIERVPGLDGVRVMIAQLAPPEARQAA